MPYSGPKPKTQPKRDLPRDKGEGVVREFPKHLNGKGCFKYQGYSHLQAECLNKRALTIKEIKEIN